MKSSTKADDEWLTTREAAKHIRQAPTTLRAWRSKKMRGRKEYDLKPTKRGLKGRVYYWRPFLDKWSKKRELMEQSPE